MQTYEEIEIEIKQEDKQRKQRESLYKKIKNQIKLVKTAQAKYEREKQRLDESLKEYESLKGKKQDVQNLQDDNLNLEE